MADDAPEPPPEQLFPHYAQWMRVYGEVRDMCNWPGAMKFLADHPETINNRNRNLQGYTLMHQAAFWGVDKGLIQSLKDMGAAPNLKVYDGNDVAGVGRANGNGPFVEALAEVFGDEDLQLRDQLSQAAKQGLFPEVIKMLKERPWLANNQSESGWSVLHQAAFHQAGQGLYRRLRALGCSTFLQTHRGASCLDIIREYHGEASFASRQYRAVFDDLEAGETAARLAVGDRVSFYSSSAGAVLGTVTSVQEDEVTVQDEAGEERSGAFWRFMRLMEKPEGEGDFEGLQQCVVCDEFVMGALVSDHCVGEEHVLCSECTVNCLWASWTNGEFPAKCMYCKAEIDIASYMLRRQLHGSWNDAHPTLTFRDFVQNYLNKAAEKKAEPIKWEDLSAEDRAHFEALIEAGTMMRCLNPQCGQLFDKLSGCNWVQCYYCKTEHCWQTKKLRRDLFGIKGCGGGHACH